MLRIRQVPSASRFGFSLWSSLFSLDSAVFALPCRPSLLSLPSRSSSSQHGVMSIEYEIQSTKAALHNWLVHVATRRITGTSCITEALEGIWLHCRQVGPGYALPWLSLAMRLSVCVCVCVCVCVGGGCMCVCVCVNVCV